MRPSMQPAVNRGAIRSAATINRHQILLNISASWHLDYKSLLIEGREYINCTTAERGAARTLGIMEPASLLLFITMVINHGKNRGFFSWMDCGLKRGAFYI